MKPSIAITIVVAIALITCLTAAWIALAIPNVSLYSMIVLGITIVAIVIIGALRRENES